MKMTKLAWPAMPSFQRNLADNGYAIATKPKST